MKRDVSETCVSFLFQLFFLFFFYRVGFRIAQKPKKWLIGCSLVVLICIGGLFRFRQEKNPLRLWMPPDSDFVSDTEWLMSHFDEGIRTQIVIMTGEDLLEPKALYHVCIVQQSIVLFYSGKNI